MSNLVGQFFRDFSQLLRQRLRLDPPPSSSNSSRTTLIPPKDPPAIFNESPFIDRDSCDCEFFDFRWSKTAATNYYYDDEGNLIDIRPPAEGSTRIFNETTTGPPRLVFFSFPRGSDGNFVDTGFYYTRNVCQNGVKVDEQLISFGNNVGAPDGVTKTYFFGDGEPLLLRSYELQIIDSQPRDLLSECFLGDRAAQPDGGGEEGDRFLGQDDISGADYDPFYDLPPPAPDAPPQLDLPPPPNEPFGGPGVGFGGQIDRPAAGGGAGGGTIGGPPQAPPAPVPLPPPIPAPPPPGADSDPNGPPPPPAPDAPPPIIVNDNPPPESQNNEELLEKLNEILEKICQEIAGELFLGEDKEPEKEGDYFEYSELGNQYNGEGLLGLKDLLEKISEQIKNLHQSQVKSINPLISLPSILPQKCNADEENSESNSRIIPVDLSAENLFNADPEEKLLSSYLSIKLMDWLLFNQKNILEESCEESIGAFVNPIFIPSNSYSGDILHIYWIEIENYPTRSEQNSIWSCQIANPIDDLNWADNFRNLRWHKGNLYAEMRYQGLNTKSKGYFLNKEKANEYFDEILKLTNLSEAEENSRSFSEYVNPKLQIRERIVRPYRAYVSVVVDEGKRQKIKSFAPLDEDYEANQ